MDLLKKYQYVIEEAEDYFTYSKYTRRVKYFDLHDHLRFTMATLEYQEQKQDVASFVTDWLILHPEHTEHRTRIENEIRYVDAVYEDMRNDIRGYRSQHEQKMREIMGTRAKNEM